MDVKDVNDGLETNPDSYWGIRVRTFIKHHPDDAFEKLKEALLNDAAAWSIFAALVMTVAFGALTLSPSDFHEDVEEIDNVQQYFYVIMHTMGAMLSFLAVMQGTQIYSYYNNLPAELMDHAIAKNNMWPPDPMVYAAVYAEGWE